MSHIGLRYTRVRTNCTKIKIRNEVVSVSKLSDDDDRVVKVFKKSEEIRTQLISA